MATGEGLDRLPDTVPRARLVDFEIAAVDIFNEGLLMAPVLADTEAPGTPRAEVRRHRAVGDSRRRSPHKCSAISRESLEDKEFVREKAGVEHTFGGFPRDRMNPNGGSVALGHPFAATGARILSQAVKELAEIPKGSRAIVSICADGGLGTVALLEH